MVPAHEAFRAAEVLAARSDNPSAFLAFNKGNMQFTDGTRDGVVVYRPAGRYLMQLGGPFAAPVDYAPLLESFLRFAAGQRRRVVAIQLQHRDAEQYARHGFTVNQMGASYAVHLPDFSLRGGKFMRLRNKVSRAQRAGLKVTECEPGQDLDQLDAIDRDWLRSKGRHTRPLQFLVGEHDGPLQAERRVFLGTLDDQPIGYISYAPVYGSRPGWLHDLSRRRAAVPPGVMEAINTAAIEAFRSEQAEWLHFGFTPFVGLDPALETPAAGRMVSRIVNFLAEHGERLYPSATQLAYKEKWGPHVVLPEYIAFHGRPRLSAVWRLARVTNAV